MMASGENFQRFFQDSAVPMHLIEEGLYLGSLDAVQNVENLRQHNITRVVGILDTFRYMQKFEEIEYWRIELPDSAQADLIPHLPDVLSFISRAQKDGKNVLVHCAAGVSRSASFVIAYIMVKYSMNFVDAKELVKSKRGCVWPNAGFQRQISSIDVQAYKKFLE